METLSVKTAKVNRCNRNRIIGRHRVVAVGELPLALSHTAFSIQRVQQRPIRVIPPPPQPRRAEIDYKIASTVAVEIPGRDRLCVLCMQLRPAGAAADRRPSARRGGPPSTLLFAVRVPNEGGRSRSASQFDVYRIGALCGNWDDRELVSRLADDKGLARFPFEAAH